MTKKEDELTIDGIIKEIIKKHGHDAITQGVENRKIDVSTISTGSIALDKALGIGGIPRGRIIEIFGDESSGKTTLSLHIIAEAQKQGLLCAFIDAEQALSLPYAKQLGVDIDKLLVSMPNSGEEGLDIAESLVKSKKVGLIVIDSVAALTPQAEIDGDMLARHIGLQARLMSQGLRKLTAIAAKTNTAIIFINQTRIMIGMTYGDPTTTTGGVALKFYTTVRIQVRRSAKLKEGDDIIGNRIKIKIAKNKISAPFKTLEYDIIFGEGISKLSEVINLGLEYDIIKKEGMSLYFEKEKLGRSIQKSKEYLKSNPNVVKKISTLIRAK
ncbi:recombinase RecA [Candidatus Babeliales bacterium]|nr:recombinase RecA [Candidatus Babeliales bacterium]